MEAIRVLIVDDHAVVRHGIESMLADDEQIQVIGEASDGATAMEQVVALRPDVVLLDIRMPDANGIEVTRRLLETVPSLKILILTNYEADEYLMQAIDAGAKGYLLKSILFEELCQAIKSVYAGDTLFDAEQVERAAHLAGGKGEQATTPLTTQEKELLSAVAAGRSIREIAAQHYWGDATARRHLFEIFRKLEIEDEDVVSESRAESFRRRFDERHGEGSWHKLVTMHSEGRTLADIAEGFGGVSREAVRQWLERGEAGKAGETASKTRGAFPAAEIPVPEASGLSVREADVLRIVATGASNREIADALGISTSTVKIHLSNIYKKLGVSARTQAVVFTLKGEEPVGN